MFDDTLKHKTVEKQEFSYLADQCVCIPINFHGGQSKLIHFHCPNNTNRFAGIYVKAVLEYVRNYKCVRRFTVAFLQ